MSPAPYFLYKQHRSNAGTCFNKIENFDHTMESCPSYAVSLRKLVTVGFRLISTSE